MIFPRIKVLNITKIFETIILRGTQHWLRSFSSQFPTSPTLYNFLWQPDMCVLVLWSSQTSNILRGMWETNPWCCCKSVPSEHTWNIQNWSYIFFKHVFVSVIMIEILPRESTPFLLFFGGRKMGPGVHAGRDHHVLSIKILHMSRHPDWQHLRMKWFLKVKKLTPVLLLRRNTYTNNKIKTGGNHTNITHYQRVTSRIWVFGIQRYNMVVSLRFERNTGRGDQKRKARGTVWEVSQRKTRRTAQFCGHKKTQTSGGTSIFEKTHLKQKWQEQQFNHIKLLISLQKWDPMFDPTLVF